jgi:hypothetical protein
MAQLIPPETAETIAGGALGVALLIFVRHPGSLVKVAVMVPLGIGAGVVFGPIIADLVNLKLTAASSLAALTSVPVANGIVRAVERIDFGAWLPGKGKADG